MKGRTSAAETGFRLLFDANPQPMLVYNIASLEILEVNDAIISKYGYSRDEFLSMTLKDIHLENDAARLEKFVHGPRSNLRASGEWKHRLKNGTIIDVEITSHTLEFGGKKAAMIVAYDITDRKRTERALREREELLSAIGGMAKVGGWEFDVQTLKGTWTEEVAKIHDLDPGMETNVEMGLSFYREESRERIESAIKKAIETGKPYDLELDMTTAKGNHKWVRTIGVPVKVGGRVVKVRGSFQDITELKEAEKALGHYRLLANHAKDIIVFTRLTDRRIIEANVAAEKAYGYTRDELLSMSVDDIRYPGEKGWTSSEETQAGKNGILFETVHIRKDGTPFPVEVNSRVIEIEGAPTVISVVRDITRRREGESRLRRQEQILRLFVENSPAAVAMLDREMKYVVVSRRFVSDYRLGDQELIGRSHYDVFPEIPERWREVHKRCLAGNVEKSDEDLFPRPDGSAQWVRWEVRPWYEDAGQIGGIIIFSEVITEQKLAAEELELSRQRLVGLINSVMDGIISLDENHKIILFNPAAEKMFGVAAADMMGKTLDSLIPDRFRGKHPGQIAAFGQPGGSSYSRHMMGMRIIAGLRKGGEEFPMEASISKIEVAGKKVYTVIHRDVTEQLRSREELRESEEKYRTLYENSTVGIYRTTPEGRILLANPALVRMLGYSTYDELSTRNLEMSGFEPSYERSEFIKTIESDGMVRGLESAWTKLDGTVIYVRESARAIRGPDGRTIYYDGVVEDITERKLSEERIRRLNRVYAVLSDINQTIVRVQDKQRLFEEACRIAVDVGKFRFAWVGLVDSGDGFLKPAAQYGEGGNLLEMIRISAKMKDIEKIGSIGFALGMGRGAFRNDIEHDGISLPWQTALLNLKFKSYASFPLKTAEGVYGTFTFYSPEVGFFDEEEMNLLEELCSDISYSVQNIEREDQRKSLQAQLIQAQKLESLGTLAGGIAHDFNNILGIIIGYSQLLQRESPAAESVNRSADAILKAASRGAGLVKQLLTFARREDSSFDHIQLNDIVLEVSRLLNETLPKTVVVSTDLKHDLPYIDADPTQIHQVLLNLCINARDAMPNGGALELFTGIAGGETVAEKFSNSKRGEYVLLRVTDSGMGMDEATKRRIFDPFFTTKEIGKGTGLGLALVHSIVTNHGGFVSVDSTPGLGTTFEIYFPAGGRGTVTSQPADAQALNAPEGTGIVLVIEDEEMLREIVRAVAGSKGYDVVSARDGEEGIQLFSQLGSEIGGVISDLGLPGISGFETLEKIRSLDPAVKLVAASGYVDPETATKLVKIGVTQILHKPYSPNDIVRTLDAVLGGNSGDADHGGTDARSPGRGRTQH